MPQFCVLVISLHLEIESETTYQWVQTIGILYTVLPYSVPVVQYIVYNYVILA